MAFEYTSKVYSANNYFSRNQWAASTNYVSNLYTKFLHPLNYYMANATIFSELVLQEQYLGHIYLINTLNSIPVIFGSQVLQAISYPNLMFNEFINCTFTNLKGAFGTAIYAEGSAISMQNAPTNTS